VSPPLAQYGKLPLHLAAQKQARLEVVLALLEVYPAAATIFVDVGVDVGSDVSPT